MAKSKDVAINTETLLQQSQINRDSNKALLMEYWEQFDGLVLTPRQRAIFMDCTPAESITRDRRMLRSRYPASKDVEEMRYELFKEETKKRSNFFTRRFGKVQ